jgi:hypothetical protein
MKIKCDKCGATVETVMPETARDGDIEHTCIPGEGAQCRIVADEQDSENREYRNCRIRMCPAYGKLPSAQFIYVVLSKKHFISVQSNATP